MQDFCNGMMQPLQGAINIRASLRCSMCPDFVDTVNDRFVADRGCEAAAQGDQSSPTQQAQREGAVERGHDAEYRLPGSSGDDEPDEGGEELQRGAEAAPVGRTDRQVAADTSRTLNESEGVCVDGLKAVFVPNLLVKLGMEHVSPQLCRQCCDWMGIASRRIGKSLSVVPVNLIRL